MYWLGNKQVEVLHKSVHQKSAIKYSCNLEKNPELKTNH